MQEITCKTSLMSARQHCEAELGAFRPHCERRAATSWAVQSVARVTRCQLVASRKQLSIGFRDAAVLEHVCNGLQVACEMQIKGRRASDYGRLQACRAAYKISCGALTYLLKQALGLSCTLMAPACETEYSIHASRCADQFSWFDQSILFVHLCMTSSSPGEMQTCMG